MGLTIPLGNDSDEISYFMVVRARAECSGVDKDCIWEVVNPSLDCFLGFGRLENEIQPLVCQGGKGVAGFRQYLTYLIEDSSVEGALLEGKVRVLIEVIMYVLSILVP